MPMAAEHVYYVITSQIALTQLMCLENIKLSILWGWQLSTDVNLELLRVIMQHQQETVL